MPMIKVNDINMHYEIQGDGFPFVMIIGLGSPCDWWEPALIEEISKKYKVLIFDNRGVGQTDKPSMKYSMKMFVDDTVGLMNALNIERAYVLGISMGGMIAQELVLNYPEYVEKLILCATNCGLSFLQKWGVRLFKPIAKLYMKSKIKTPEKRGEYLIKSMFTEEFIKENPKYIEKARQRLLKTPTPFEDYLRQFNAILNHNTRKRLKNIDKPTLILHGKRDTLVSYKSSLKLAELIPYPKLVLFNNSGHALFSQETDKVLQMIFEFLS